MPQPLEFGLWRSVTAVAAVVAEFRNCTDHPCGIIVRHLPVLISGRKHSSPGVWTDGRRGASGRSGRKISTNRDAAADGNDVASAYVAPPINLDGDGRGQDGTFAHRERWASYPAPVVEVQTGSAMRVLFLLLLILMPVALILTICLLPIALPVCAYLQIRSARCSPPIRCRESYKPL